MFENIITGLLISAIIGVIALFYKFPHFYKKYFSSIFVVNLLIHVAIFTHVSTKNSMLKLFLFSHKGSKWMIKTIDQLNLYTAYLFISVLVVSGVLFFFYRIDEFKKNEGIE